WTESASLGHAFDHGAHFLHLAPENPFRSVADALGMTYLRGGYQTRYFADRWLGDPEGRAVEANIRKGLVSVARAGRAGDGQSVAAAWPELVGSEKLLRGIYEEFLGARGEDVDAAEHTRYKDTFEDWPMQDGFGALISRWADGIPVVLGCPVRCIDSRGKLVRMETARGALFARNVLLTVSTGVLAANAIRFLPDLPDWKRAAIDAVPMGYAGKVAFRLASGALAGIAPHQGLVYSGGLFANIHVRPFGKPVLVAIIGGPTWELIERCGPAAMEAAARDLVIAAYGKDALGGLTGVVSTTWLSDPFVRGGHSYKRPVALDARTVLSEPIDGRIHFAGEACSGSAWATVHGAQATALSAVTRIANSTES
ncbi:MAG: flavin monoamine oxidase family protein, partial [Paracoccaceae bacterium]